MADDPKRAALGALHEVSNALTVLLGWVAEAREPDATPEEVERALRIIEQRGRAARDLARRAIGAKVPASLEGDAGLEGLLAEIVEALGIEAQKAGVSLVREDEPALAICRVPLGAELSRIVTNLVMNALAFAPKGTRVVLRTKLDARAVLIDVVDEGPGVPAERSFSVFEGDTTRQGGAGVGLSHARTTARAAGGDVQLLDTRPGATFRVTWPRDIPTLTHPVPPESTRSSRPKLQVLAGKRVLIVEDDTDVTDLLESALSARGAEVTIARTAQELADRIDGGHHAVLVDLSPIADDVMGALDLVRREAENAEIVFITGSAEALPQGMEDAAWLRKPFEVGELVAVLTRVSIKQP